MIFSGTKEQNKIQTIEQSSSSLAVKPGARRLCCCFNRCFIYWPFLTWKRTFSRNSFISKLIIFELVNVKLDMWSMKVNVE